MLPTLRLAPSGTRGSLAELGQDLFLHTIYAASAGAAYDLLNRTARPAA